MNEPVMIQLKDGRTVELKCRRCQQPLHKVAGVGFVHPSGRLVENDHEADPDMPDWTGCTRTEDYV